MLAGWSHVTNITWSIAPIFLDDGPLSLCPGFVLFFLLCCCIAAFSTFLIFYVEYGFLRLPCGPF